MIYRVSNIIFKILLVAVLCTSCKEKSCKEPVPYIEFQSFEQFGDSAAKLSIYFKDCDGDIGLNQGDTVAPYDYNLFLEYYEKRFGVWTHLEPHFPFYYRVPSLDGKTPYDLKEGQIILDMGIYYNPSSTFDTIRYEIMLKDRALNESNLAITDEIIIVN